MRTKAHCAELSVEDVSVQVGEKAILEEIQLQARSGELLAVLGPTGSGKTTLLNVISGRLKPTNGKVKLNGKSFGKKLRRRLAFVQQQDVFFSQLTLWETLYFTARIRLPGSLSEAEKREKIDDIVESLDMKKCINTVIGDIFTRGLSGGEKKRASIACELLTDPDILLMDEPTSGLDSFTALTLMRQMDEYAKRYNKMIITTIHQPSSQIYHMFHNILLLINGHEAYCGPGSLALSFFEELGFRCEPHFNPADFILQMAKSDEEKVNSILSATKSKRNGLSNHVAMPGLHVKPPVNTADGKSGATEKPETEKQDIDLSVGNHVSKHTEVGKIGGGNIEMSLVIEKEESDVKSSLLQLKEETSKENSSQFSRWPASWWTQYYMLSWRSFKQTKGLLLQGYSFVQTTITALLIGVMYWQIEQNLDTVRDVMGLLFFAVSYWTFNPAFEAISQYPAEKAVISKERAAGSYRLSAYYISKITSDLPLSILLPTLMYTILFTMSGIGGVAQFFMTYPVILLQVLLSQGFGFAVGVAFNGEIKPAFTTFVTYSLCAFLVGGFFTQRLPQWFMWAKYLSTMLYPFGTLSVVIFSQYPPFQCDNSSAAVFPQCGTNTTTSIYYTDILSNAGLTLPVHFYIFPVFLFIIAFRVIGYFLLKYRRPKML